MESLLTDKQMVVDLHQPTDLILRLDKDRILQVFINLFSNAIKFSEPGSRIAVICSEQEAILNHYLQPVLQIAITDEGVGIPQGETEAVFDSFIQSSMTRSAAGGTGLGLAISKQIISMHDGRIYAQSPPPGKSRGSVFYIELPIADQQEQEATMLDKQSVVMSHLNWKNQLEKLFDNSASLEHLDVAGIADDHLCPLGKWLDAFPENSQTITELKQAHDEFHQHAAECIAFFEVQDKERAKSAKQRFDRASEKVLGLLESV